MKNIPNENILKVNDNKVTTQQLINIHQSIAFVLQCNNSKYPGQNAAKVFIDKLNELYAILVH